LREAESESGAELDEATTLRIISDRKTSEASSRTVRVDKDILSRYFGDEKTDADISSTIAKALEAWFANGGE
jgi:hypothetical protein